MEAESTSGRTHAAPAAGVRGWLRTLLDVLLGPVEFGPTPRVFSLRTPTRLIGPGSVPLAGVFLAITAQLLNTQYEAEQPAALVFATTQAAAIVLARYRALVAWLLAFVSFVSIAELAEPIDQHATPTPWPWLVPGMLGYLVVQYATTRFRPPWVGFLAWVVVGVVGLLIGLQAPERLSIHVLAIVLSGAALVIGIVNRSRHDAHRRLLEQEQTSAAERARREMLEDRARIARELHDVVAHHMSVIAVQSSTAGYRIADLPDEARQEFGSIAGQARESLTEMRRLLGILRSDDAAADTAPQPGLDNIEQVVDATRRADTPVQLTIDDLPTGLPAGVDITAYRVVQEALSNVVRHAPGARATVEIHADAEQLVIRVTNTPPTRSRPDQHDLGPGPTDGPAPGSTSGSTAGSTAGPTEGHGVRGMRERVAALSGRLVVGPRPDGGFDVQAALPLEPTPPDEPPSDETPSTTPPSATPPSTTPSEPDPAGNAASNRRSERPEEGG